MRRTLAVVLTVALLVPAVTGGAAAGVQGSIGGGPVAQQGGVDCGFPVSVTDATGTTVTVDGEPNSVVTLWPSAAQTMWEIGAEEKVVGMPVGPTTSYLEGYDTRRDIVDNFVVVQEEVIALEPDLVLAPNVTRKSTIRSLRDAGQTVYHVQEAKSLEDVYEKTRLIGELVGAYDAASERAARMEGTVDAVRDAVAGEPEPEVVYLTGSSGFAAGTNTFIGELIAAAGGENIVPFDGYRELSGEVLISENPDWIVIPEGRSLPKTAAVNSTTAVQEDQILRVNGDFVSQAGPRNTEPLTAMAEAFHPTAYDPAAVESPSLPSYPTCGEQGQEQSVTEQYDTNDDGQIGVAELTIATLDFATGKLTTAQLVTLVTAFAQA